MAEPAESDSAPRGDTRRRWRLVLAAVAVAATLGVVAIVFARRPEPFRVLIAVDVGGQPWTGSRPAVVIAEQLSARLVQFGFEPVDLSVAENRKRLGQADSLTAAAKKLRASFVVSAHLEPSLELYSLSGGHAEARVKGPIELAYRGEPPIEVGRVAAFSGAPLKERALEQLGEQLADRVFDVVLPALMDHESIQKRVTGGDAAIKGRFSRATGYVTRRRTRLDQARRAYQSLGEKRLAEERGPVKPTYHGSLDRSIGLSGTGAKGALLKSSEAPPFFMPDTSELVPLSELERLFWLTPDGTEQDVFSGYHIAGYASVAPAGSPIVLMEDISGWAKALVTIDASGQATRLRIEPVRVLADPKIAPDGRAVALWDRACRGCPGGVLVLALPNGRELMRTDGRTASLGGFSWLGPNRLALLERPASKPLEPEAKKPPTAAPGKTEKETTSGPPAQQLIVADFSTSPAALDTLYTTAGESLTAPVASKDGQKIVFARRADDGRELSVFDVASRQMLVLDVAGVSDPAVSPTGDAVAFERYGEIAVAELPSGRVRELTKNPFTDRYPMFTPDGRRVLFESRGEDPNFERRMVSVLASVPAR